jgi:hypothetical protein
VILLSPKEPVSKRLEVQDGSIQVLGHGDLVFWKREHLITGNYSTLRENSPKLVEKLRKLGSHKVAAEVQVDDEAHKNHANPAINKRRSAIMVALAHAVSQLSG